MPDPKWNELNLDRLIVEILDIPPKKENHPFGRPFLTPYQIAIELKKRIPSICEEFGLPIGGKGTGIHHSLAQYLARMLSQHIKNDSLPNVEGRFLQMSNISHLEFDDFGESVEASSLSGLSMYRRTD